MTDIKQQSEAAILFSATSAPQPVISAAEVTQPMGCSSGDPASFLNGIHYPCPLEDFRGLNKAVDRFLS